MPDLKAFQIVGLITLRRRRLVIDTAFAVAIDLAVEAGHTVLLRDESSIRSPRP